MAPMTAKEKMRLYRERMTEKQRKTALEKDKLRKKESRAKRSFEQKKIDSTKSYERVKKSRAAKKLLQPSTSCSSMHSPQVIGKAVKKVLSSLPKSPTKKIDVIEKLAHMTGLEIQTNIRPSQTARPNAISPETVALVNTFYESVDISQEAPGRKDYIII